MIIAVILGVVSNALFFLLGHSSSGVIQWLRLRAVRQLWRPFRTDKHIQIVVTTRPGPNQRSTPRVSLSEMRAYIRLAETCQALGLIPAPVDSSARLDDISNSNLVVLGGPAANGTAAEIWKRISPHIPFVFDLTSYSLRIGERVYQPEDAPTGRLKLDYGLLIRHHSPFDPNRQMFLCFGCHGFATNAAARILSDRTVASELARRTVNSENFVAAFEAQLHENTLAEIKILELYNIPR